MADGPLPPQGVDYAWSRPDIAQLAAAAGKPVGRPRTSLWDRFWPKVDAAGDCWQWTGGVSGSYGVVRPGGQANQRGAHVVAWELLIGPVPDGYQVDHRCKNTLCVNPDHLEPVPPLTNLMRSAAWSARNAAASRCPKEHEYTPENTRVYRGRRHCRECDRLRLRQRRGNQVGGLHVALV